MSVLLNKLETAISQLHNKNNIRKKKIKVSSNLIIRGKLYLQGAKQPDIQIGDNVIINSSRRANPTGGITYTMFTVYEGAQLIIGNNTGISNSTVVCRESVIIGSNVYIGVDNIIYDTDMHSVEYKERIGKEDRKVKSAPVVIGDGAWICGHCIILKGVHIGKRSVIAAGSVVTKDVPDDELWGGNPCKFIRKINVDESNIIGE